MHISNIYIENFRKFKTLDLVFNKGLNVLIGENDSGKTAIIDAIKFVLGTHSNDWLRLEKEDFYSYDGRNYEYEMKIICTFKNLNEDEAAMFLEWLSIDSGIYYLKLTLKAKRKDKGNSLSEISYDIKAGEDEESGVMSGLARNKLRATYLKPLRDAEYELAPRKGSRLSQILNNYEIFQKEQPTDEHRLETIMREANESIENYFLEEEGIVISKKINDDFLGKDGFSLLHNPLSSKFGITKQELGRILERLELQGFSTDSGGNLGLGSNNLLFIAAEMLLLKGDNYVGLKLSLIEEIEAHLHPQAQINLIDFLSKQSETLGLQTILSTHSNSLASKVDLNNLILCKNGKAFSLRKGETKLNLGDYGFLKRFLDDTKANLFFANGVIIVEGDAENLLLPTFAEFIGYPLHKYGISIVNVGSTALLRYAKIFQRHNGETIGMKISCIIDRDIPPQIAKDRGLLTPDRLIEKDSPTQAETDEIDEIVANRKASYEGGDVKAFLTKNWTLEYDIALSNSKLRELMHISIQLAKEIKLLSNRKHPRYELNFQDFFKITRNCKKELVDWTNNNISDKEIALSIYTPLLKKHASKPVAAQYFVHFLDKFKNNDNLRGEVLADEYLKYLVEAIKYAANVPN